MLKFSALFSKIRHGRLKKCFSPYSHILGMHSGQCCAINDTLQYSTWYTAVLYMIHCSTLHSTLQYSTWYNAVLYMVHCSTLHSTLQFTTWYAAVIYMVHCSTLDCIKFTEYSEKNKQCKWNQNIVNKYIAIAN